MDLLQTAVVDITTLVACCHACRSGAAQGGLLQRKQRQHLRGEIRRATVAYIDVLARSRRGGMDDALLVECRLAAEQVMPKALAQQALLGRMLDSEEGALDGLAAARQDLWRLAHISIHLGSGLAALQAFAQGAVGTSVGKSVRNPAARLRRHLRRALIAYALAALRAKESKGRLLLQAREAAWAQLAKRGIADAERLVEAEAHAGGALCFIRQGVLKPLLDLKLDWQGHPVA